MDSRNLRLPNRPSHGHTHSTGSMPGGRKRVGFTGFTMAEDSPPTARTPLPRTPEEEYEGFDFGQNTNTNTNTNTLKREMSHEELSQEIHKAFGEPYIPKPRPAIRKTDRTLPDFDLEEAQEDEVKQRSGRAAQKRAAQLSKSVGTYSASAPVSRRPSAERLNSTTPSIELSNLPDVSRETLEDASTDEDEAGDTSTGRREFLKEADKLLRAHSHRGPTIREEDLYHSDVTPLQSGQVTPTNEMEIDDEHIPRPPKYRASVLGTLLKATGSLQAPALPSSGRGGRKPTGHGRNPSSGSLAMSDTSTLNSSLPSPSLPSPGHSRPWYSRSANSSTTSISRLIETSGMLAVPAQKEGSEQVKQTAKKQRPGMGSRTTSSNSLASISSAFKKSKAARDEQYKIKIHLAGTLARQNYLRKLCKALMMYGAPTHRLEEYLNMSARVLEIEAQFLYMPGCMIIAFDDSSVHTSEVKLVRTAQGVDLGKLQDVHEIYKDVVHDRIAVDEATPRLEEIMHRKSKYKSWARVPLYGLASASVGPFAFEARPIDIPFCFVLGCILGWLQLIVAPSNELISNVFEITAAVVTSFIARGLGSIKHKGDNMFCFSAMAQSSIALILPGFTVLSASLELQSRHIVAGSVRMVYAIIYSLFLGFGITIGTVLYGMMDHNATSDTHCKNPLNKNYNYLFVLVFSLCLCLINQAKWKQAPAMVVISLIGYAVSFNSSLYFKNNSQVSSTLGALAIGVSANLHARFGRHIENWWLDRYETSLRPRWVRLRKRWLRRNHGYQKSHKAEGEGSGWASTHRTEDRHSPESSASSIRSEPYVPRTRKIGFGLAAAAMLPAIFVQVPSGLSVGGSLVSGINSADQITRNSTSPAGSTTVTGSDASAGGSVNSVALQVGFSVIQVAIGITVGLFLSALLVYPFGKRRSGLFSF